jgi:hypothetical protein
MAKRPLKQQMIVKFLCRNSADFMELEGSSKLCHRSGG